MTQAVSEAAKAKITWLAEHLEEREILTGFNDMKMDSELYATEEMIRYYKAHENKWTVHRDTKKYFDEMIRIAENGKLKDHILIKL